MVRAHLQATLPSNVSLDFLFFFYVFLSVSLVYVKKKKKGKVLEE